MSAMSIGRLAPRGIRPRVLMVTVGIRPSDFDGREVGPAARRVDALDLHDDRVAEAQGHAGLGADEHRLLLVELPPVAAQAAHGQEALVALAEGDEGARA